jgi:predicted TIM-barrel fold metal-dependent hydrolase
VHKPSPESPYFLNVQLAQVNAALALLNLLASPVPRRFPGIQIVVSEGGIGWVAPQLERADRTWERHRYWGHADDLRPSDAFRRNFYGAFVDDQIGIELRHAIGVDRIMWECDYPHAEAAWPNSQEVVEKALSGVPRDEAELVTSGNARRLFRWDR